MGDDGTLVYSTEGGRIRPEKGKKSSPKRGKPERKRPAGRGVRVMRETKGRKGKPVTVVTGLSLPEDELKALGKDLKALCGAGGSVKDGAIEVQGEHRDRLVEALKARGYDAKKSGG